jgi:cation diffusion facilitator family transporter
MMVKSKTPVVVTWISIVLNSLLFVIKFWAGMVSNSVALIADAWHTLSDSISSFAVLIGLKYASQPADKTHPYGHGRAELIASLVVGVLLAVVGFNFLVESIIKFREKTEFTYGPIAVWVTVASVIIKEVMARYSLLVGKKFNYNSLKADGWHHRSDAISSIVILGGIFFGKNIWWIDSALGLMVSILIFITTWNIMKDSISILLGEGLELEKQQEIIRMAANIEPFMDLDAHHFKVHYYGNHTELSFHIRLPGALSLEKAHEIASRYEELVEDTLNVTVTIHVDAEECTLL